MKAHILLIIFPLLLLASESDTTYGQFEPVRKASTSSSSSSNSSSERDSSRDDDDDDDFSLFGAILKAIFSKDDDEKVQSNSYSSSRSSTRTSIKSNSSTSYKSNSFDNSMTRSLYCGIGINGRIHDFSGLGSAGAVSPTLSLYWFSPANVKLRTSIAPSWGKSSGSDIDVNFQQPRYVDGILDGSRTFITDNTSLFQFPLSLDLLIAPGDQEFFNIIIGGAMAYEKEIMSGTWSDTNKDEAVEYTSWEPQLRTGLGIMVPNKVGAILIELNLNVLTHDDSGETPTLSNNSETSILVGGSFSILF